MKTCIGGDGADTTAAVLAWLTANNPLHLCNLYLIGEYTNPNAIWLTDYESPLLWSPWGTFLPAVITRGAVKSAIGLDVSDLDINWAASNSTPGRSIATASPYQLAQQGFYDNWPVRVWTCYMPTPGDANTLGCSELFGGRISSNTTAQGQIQFKVQSFLAVVNQYVPTNVIELQNTGASYTGATAPHFTNGRIPLFNTVVGSSTNVIVGDCITDGYFHHVFADNDFQHGFLVYNTSPQSTLGGVWSAIQQNTGVVVDGIRFNQFELFSPLPWPPTPGVDNFYVSASPPVNSDALGYLGFPFVPSPTSSA